MLFNLRLQPRHVIAFIALVAFIYLGLNYTRKKGYIYLNTGLLCITFVVVGFSSWLLLPIRANANVTVNENNPSSARELLAYYNLEQYPKTHLFYGPQFTDQYAGPTPSAPDSLVVQPRQAFAHRVHKTP